MYNVLFLTSDFSNAGRYPLQLFLKNLRSDNPNIIVPVNYASNIQLFLIFHNKIFIRIPHCPRCFSGIFFKQIFAYLDTRKPKSHCFPHMLSLCITAPDCYE